MDMDEAKMKEMLTDILNEVLESRLVLSSTLSAMLGNQLQCDPF